VLHLHNSDDTVSNTERPPMQAREDGMTHTDTTITKSQHKPPPIVPTDTDTAACCIRCKREDSVEKNASPTVQSIRIQIERATVGFVVCVCRSFSRVKCSSMMNAWVT
jgi:hypothetical protein